MNSANAAVVRIQEDMAPLDDDERIEYCRHVVAQGEEAGFSAMYVATAKEHLRIMEARS